MSETKFPPGRPSTVTKPRELHIFDEGVDPRGLNKFRIEIREVFLGRPRVVRKFPVHGNHLERLKLRYQREFKVPVGNVFVHEAGVEVPLGGESTAPDAVKPFPQGG
jgi:hypothetical protein